MILYLTHKSATLQNSTFKMTIISASHISFIQSLLLTKVVGLDSNSNLVSMMKFSAQSKMLWRFGMHFSARRFSFRLYLQCKIWSIFHYCKAIFGYNFFFMIIFDTSMFLKMKMFNNFLVGIFLIGIGLVIGL